MEVTGISFPSPLPRHFGKYTVLGHLATGGMAEVHVARATGIEGFEKIVVIKRIRPDLVGNRETTEAFLHEAKLAATLEHPNIAQVYEIGIVNESYFFAMEYVHGADLRQLMEAALHRAHQISLSDAVQIMIGVCAALHYAHEKRAIDGAPLDIIHRDVSPSNVLISHDGAIKVCDFGIAKAATRQRETVRGVIKGKFSYMSPEQCRAAPLDRRSDVFSIGILLYELSTLTRLFDGETDFEVMRKILEEPLVPPSKVVAAYPPELERIVCKALSRAPGERYPTAQALQLELEAFARERKLALSTVGISSLMRALFGDRIDAWLHAQREGKGLGDHLIDRAGAIESLRGMPVFSPQVEHSAQVEIQPVPVTTIATGASFDRQRPRPTRAFAIAAIAAIAAGAGALGAEHALAESHRRAVMAAIEEDARQIATALDTQVQGAHLRCDGIAGAPMLSAVIATDAATVHDLAREGTLSTLATLARGEAIELFQRGGAAPSASLLRIPNAGAPLPALDGREVRVVAESGEVAVLAGAPIPPYRSGDLGGSVTCFEPVDRALLRGRLADHAARATLEGLRASIPLAGAGALPAEAATAAAGATVSVPVPPLASRGDLVLSVVASPYPADRRWLSLASYGLWAAAAGLLAVHVVRRRRGRHAA